MDFSGYHKNQDHQRSLCCTIDWSTLDKCDRRKVPPVTFLHSLKNFRHILNLTGSGSQSVPFSKAGFQDEVLLVLLCPPWSSLWELLKTISQDPSSPAALPPAVCHQTETMVSVSSSTLVTWCARRCRLAERLPAGLSLPLTLIYSRCTETVTDSLRSQLRWAGTGGDKWSIFNISDDTSPPLLIELHLWWVEGVCGRTRFSLTCSCAGSSYEFFMSVLKWLCSVEGINWQGWSWFVFTTFFVLFVGITSTFLKSSCTFSIQKPILHFFFHQREGHEYLIIP